MHLQIVNSFLVRTISIYSYPILLGVFADSLCIGLKFLSPALDPKAHHFGPLNSILINSKADTTRNLEKIRKGQRK